MKSLLVPIDFSPTAKNAVDVAAFIARQAGAKLILLHVVEQLDSRPFYAAAPVDEESRKNRSINAAIIERANRQLSVVAAGLVDAGIEVSKVLRIGKPHHSILSIVAETRIDLVVMGMNGRSPLDEILIGSNTERVIRRSLCPVLAVNGRPTKLRFDSIVFALSLKTGELFLPPVVRELQQLFGSTLHLVRVNTPGTFTNDRLVKEKMTAFADKMSLKDFTLNIYNDFTEEAGILNFADSVGADMIAVATHGRKGIAHLLNGSIAEDVSRHSRRCVLVTSLSAS